MSYGKNGWVPLDCRNVANCIDCVRDTCGASYFIVFYEPALVEEAQPLRDLQMKIARKTAKNTYI